ncbi:unnamed protein product [Clavelina lepadiformis]|uniref:Uncharacterized protein n=1 Tax=Clavelina lepadiformis TaxID=159417 RepID=A0ABP0G9G8_CLALP
MNHANSSVSEATHQPTIGKPVTAGRVLKRPQATTTAAPVKTPAKSSPKSRPSIGNWCKLLDKSFSNFCAHSTRTRSFVFKCGTIRWKKLGNNSSDVDSHSSKSNSTATTVPTKTSLKLGLRNDMQWCRFLDKFAKMCDRSVKTRNYLIEKCGSYKQPLIALRCTKCRYIMKFCDGQARSFGIRN